MCEGGRMYEISGSSLCHVASCIMYTSKLNTKCEALFQKPNDEAKPDHKICYCNLPLGKHYLGNLMASISTDARLSQRYTNHSIRATCRITLLDSNNLDARHIVSVSLHKSEASIRSYSHQTTVSKKQEMSDALGASLGITAAAPKKEQDDCVID